MSLFNALVAVLFLSGEPTEPRLPMEPLTAENTHARAVQLAETFAKVCQGADGAMSSSRARAEALGFTPVPERIITGKSGFSGGTFVREMLLMHPARDPAREPLLAVSILERRSKEGAVVDGSCELYLPSTAFAVPTDEAKAVFEVARRVLSYPNWQLETVETQIGRMSGSSIVVGEFEFTYAGTMGLHRLLRAPKPERSFLTVPR